MTLNKFHLICFLITAGRFATASQPHLLIKLVEPLALKLSNDDQDQETSSKIVHNEQAQNFKNSDDPKFNGHLKKPSKDKAVSPIAYRSDSKMHHTLKQSVSSVPVVAFYHKVFHYENIPRQQWKKCPSNLVKIGQNEPPCQVRLDDYQSIAASNQESKEDPASSSNKSDVDENRYFHDIYQRSTGPHDMMYGHVLSSPDAFESRFENISGGKRFKGQVYWADNSKGIGERFWDLVLGKL